MIQLYSISDKILRTESTGFVDDTYRLVISVNDDDNMFENISLHLFKYTYTIKDCIDILCNLVRQCFWSDLEFIKFIRAKLKLCNISGNDLDAFIMREVDTYLEDTSSGNDSKSILSDVKAFTYKTLLKVCEEAKIKEIS